MGKTTKIEADKTLHLVGKLLGVRDETPTRLLTGDLNAAPLIPRGFVNASARFEKLPLR
jgi:hypothetical protein